MLGAAWGQHGSSCEESALFESRGRCKSATRKGEHKKRLIKDLNFLFAHNTEKDGHFKDEYEVERVIGKGAFGTVYTTRNRLLGHSRAVKRLRADTMDPESAEMIKSEIHALMALDHPNIVKLIRYFETPIHIYLVFDLCDGPDLGKHIKNRLRACQGGLPEHEAADVLRQMLQSLKRCHCNYIGHFDVKPENFMYESRDSTRNLQMIDLGLSSGFKKDKSVISGSALYMAPEVWEGIYGPEADIWSCGVVFFYMLTGRHLLPTDKTEEEIQELVHDRNFVRRQLQAVQAKGVSKECFEMLKTLLSNNRHRRPTAREALRHPLFSHSGPARGETDEDPEVQKEANEVMKAILPSLRSLAVEPVLKRAILLGVAHLAAHSYHESQPQRLAFSILDRDFDGTLSLECLERYFDRTVGKIPVDLEAAFRGVDIDDDGYISYVEFLAATLPDPLRYNEKILSMIFGFLDQDHDGVIDSADLKKVFCPDDDEPIDVCEKALAEVCTENEKLDKETFTRLMTARK